MENLGPKDNTAFSSTERPFRVKSVNSLGEVLQAGTTVGWMFESRGSDVEGIKFGKSEEVICRRESILENLPLR
jgi:hypothetical protein